MNKNIFNKEAFYQLLKDPSREKIREILQENFGESNEVDYKKDFSDGKAKLAKLVLAMANNGGGIIIFGVEEKKDGTIFLSGLEGFKEPTQIGHDLENYIPKNLNYSPCNYDYESSDYDDLKEKKIQVIYVYSTKQDIPYISTGECGDLIKKDIIYIRRDSASVPINNEELRHLIKKRVAAELKFKSNLKLTEHLSQLEALYDAKENNVHPLFLTAFQKIKSSKEDYQATMDDLIRQKIKLVEKILGVSKPL